MKKTLLTTTAIIAAFVATDASANNLQVNIGGYADFQAGNVSDDIVGEGTDLTNETQFNTDSEIHVSVEGAADNGLEYGAVVELEANVSDTSDTYDNGANADKAYLFVQGGWGRVEAGENTGAEEALAVDTSNFASATGGVDGDWYRYASAAPAGSGGTIADGGTSQTAFGDYDFIVKPKLAMAHSGTGSLTDQSANEDATKITYYSPRFAGFQVGASYTPNSGDTGRTGSAAAAAATASDNEDVFAGGINYTNQFDQIGVAGSLTAVSGSAKQAKTADLSTQTGANTLAAATIASDYDVQGYAAGANLTFAGFTVGGSYGDYQDTIGASDATYYDAGVGYTAGAFSVSATYLSSEVEKSTLTLNGGTNDATSTADDDFAVRSTEFDSLVIGADYQLAPGLVPYAEVAMYEYDGAGAVKGTDDNEGTVVMLGTELSF